MRIYPLHHTIASVSKHLDYCLCVRIMHTFQPAQHGGPSSLLRTGNAALLHLQTCVVKQVGQGGCQQLPWIPTCLTISGLSSVQDAWYLASVVCEVDRILFAKCVVVDCYCLCYLLVEHVDELVVNQFVEGHVDCMHDTAVDGALLGFPEVRPVPVLQQFLFQRLDLLMLLLSPVIIIHRSCELSPQFQCPSHGLLVPEHVLRPDFLPQVACFCRRVIQDVIQVVCDRPAAHLLRASPQVQTLYFTLPAGFDEQVCVLDESESAQTRPVVLRPAPTPGIDRTCRYFLLDLVTDV